MVPTWLLEDNLKELVPSFHHVAPGGQTLVIRLGIKHHPQSHSADPFAPFFTHTLPLHFMSCLDS